MSAEWLAAIAALASPLAALAGVWIGAGMIRRSDRELDHWRRREETMRMLRWAGEQLDSDHTGVRRLGLVTLSELVRSELLQPEDAALVTEVFDTALEEALGSAYAELEDPDVEAMLEEGPDGG
ncbi:MAG: hypothetical protein ACRDP9_04740 [Kribbellaceae bacterium]|jgi:hypothetical protein|nr:hypothetical protein [Kribbellaceae bacterium]